MSNENIYKWDTWLHSLTVPQMQLSNSWIQTTKPQ